VIAGSIVLLGATVFALLSHRLADHHLDVGL
jgi:hypothetical protein